MPLIDFNNEQKLIQSEIRKFSQAELEPVSGEIDKNGSFPIEIVKKLSDLGLSSLIIPEEYNGAGLDTTSLCIALEELSKSCASVGTILTVNNCLVALPIIKYGSKEKKDYYLKKLAAGDIGAYVADMAIDVVNKKIEVKEDDGNYLVSGEKDFLLNGEAADFFIMPLSLSRGKALYLLEKEKSGIELTKQEILGMRAAGITSLEFKGIKLLKDFCLVSEDNGEKVLAEIRDYSNIGFSAVSLGIAEAALDASIKYSKERKQFGRAIGEFPMVQEMLVDMKTRIEAAQFLVYEAAFKFDEGQNYSLNASMARLMSGETAVFAGIKSIQIHGGYGYTKDYPVERFLRDAKTVQLLDETPLALKEKIIRELIG